MSNFFKQRLKNHFKELLRYLKYVFNDFFVIALMFFIGALGLTYANLLKGLVAGQWWEKVVLLIVLILGLQVCGLATLINRPDQVFLAPKEYSFKDYLKAAFNYSFIMAILFQALLIFILMPFITISLSWSVLEVVGLWGLMIILKWSVLKNQLASFYQNYTNRVINKLLINVILPVVCLLSSIWQNVFLGICLSLIFALCLQLFIVRKSKLLNWETLVVTEEKRMLVIYRFFSLFKDVPEIKAKSKHRSWANFLIKLVKPKHDTTFTNLYLITFIRDGEISNFFFRLIVLGFFLMIFIKNPLMSVFIYALFIYLVGFQLIPLYMVFDDNVFVHVYPISSQMRLNNFRSLIRTILLFEIIVLTIGALFSGISISFIAGSIVIGLLEIYYLTGPYLKNKFKNEMEF